MKIEILGVSAKLLRHYIQKQENNSDIIHQRHAPACFSNNELLCSKNVRRNEIRNIVEDSKGNIVPKTRGFDFLKSFKSFIHFSHTYVPCKCIQPRQYFSPSLSLLFLINQRIIRLVPCSQFWAAYVPCESQHLNAVQLTLEQVDLIKRLIEKYSQHMQFAASSTGEYLSRLSETATNLNSTAP